MKYEKLLKKDESVVFALRQLYLENGYKHFKMSKFLEYDFYSKNKDSLLSSGVITFTDTDGKLLALKPDVTLSIIKNYKGESGISKYFYNENVYRISKSTGSYKEIMQSGLECMGDVGEREVYDVLRLAAQSLEKIGPDFRLCVSSIDLIDALLCEYGVTGSKREGVILAVSEKNEDMLKSFVSGECLEALSNLLVSSNSLEQISQYAKGDKAKAAIEALNGALSYLEGLGYADKVFIDFSYFSLDGYYNGIVFKGFVGSLSSAVVSGGQYDGLMRNMGREGKAIGFAVYLDEIEYLSESADTAGAEDYINVALPKGRLGEKIYAMFEKAGLDCPSIKENTRKLIYENPKNKMRFFWVKPSDVAIYVERGAADIGVAGKDFLLEYSPDVFELLDLNEGKCRMAVAAKRGFCDDEGKTLRVATKFANIAKHFYNEKCRDIEIIHLNGSIELAPILSLSDVIVDIVETGKTLLENGLEPIETINEISARLISNKASYSFKNQRIEEIKTLLSGVAGLEK